MLGGMWMANGVTQEQMVERMYTEMVGINGKSGMKKDIVAIKTETEKGFHDARGSRKILHEKVEKIEKQMVTKDECLEIRQTAKEEIKDEKRWNWKKRMGYFTLQVAVMSLFIGFLTFLIDKCGGLFGG